MDVKAVTLEGERLRLEPLSAAHAQGLLLGADDDSFRLSIRGPVAWTEAGVREFIESILADTTRIPLSAFHKETGELVGGSSYLNILPDDRALEVGYTWVAKPWQRTFVNPEMKLLMLSHAFEDQDAVRVQLKTDSRNKQSEAAMIKLGLRFEGVLKHHMILPDGFVRDSLLFSVTDDEWPELKQKILGRLSEFRVGESD